MNYRNRSNKRGFTLVELLVVIAIIMILVALLMPAFQRLRDMTDSVVCQSNLRQLMMGVTLFAGDNRGEYPDPWRWWVSNGAPGGWGGNQAVWVDWSKPDCITNPAASLWPYIQNQSVYLCPTFKRYFKLNPAYAHLTPYTGYSMNEYIYSLNGVGPYSWAGQNKIHRTEINDSGFAVLGDEGTLVIRDRTGKQVNSVFINNGCLGVGNWADPNSICDSLFSLHLFRKGDPTTGCGNAAFADGHVELLDPSRSKEVFTPKKFK
jgi:prepilin-type N-terminal cleavage/methylation domain-containing protein/prepilin-type processing-associated H-X9-DG protein